MTTSSRRQLTPLEPLVGRIEAARALDSAGKAAGKTVRDAVGGGALKDVLSGTWLGHAVHPMLTDVVIGTFTSASLLDIVAPGSRVASRRLIGLGLLAYLPTAAAGASDWADTEVVDPAIRRLGLVHAGCNAVGASLYTTSWRARRRGSHGLGALLGFAGMGVMAAGGYLGGHLSLSKGVGPDQTVFDRGPDDWTQAGEISELAEDAPRRVVVDDTPVLLLRRGSEVFAIHDRCSHRGCSLSDGSIEADEVVCGCHGSRFALRDGALRHGPATAAQPAFETRTREGRVEIRRATTA